MDMITASELRVTNLLLESGEVCKVFKIQRGKYSVWTKRGRRNSTLCEPIPLTSEILEKCGFEQQGEYGVINFPPRMGIRFYNFNYAECDIIQDDKFISFKNSHIKYLHQLQNLFYILCGQELEIELDIYPPLPYFMTLD